MENENLEIEVATEVAPEAPAPAAGITLRVTPLLREHLEAAAKESGKSLNQWLVALLTNHFEGAVDPLVAVHEKLDRLLAMNGPIAAPGIASTEEISKAVMASFNASQNRQKSAKLR